MDRASVVSEAVLASDSGRFQWQKEQAVSRTSFWFTGGFVDGSGWEGVYKY
jgi:hypothetical protein